MNWEKTVMHLDDIDEGRMPDSYGSLRKALKKQAEISYKAGEVAGYKRGLEMEEPYLEGIREVVEWVESNIMLTPSTPVYNKWQAFKKENGL